jgi:hypothetical protein
MEAARQPVDAARIPEGTEKHVPQGHYKTYVELIFRPER